MSPRRAHHATLTKLLIAAVFAACLVVPDAAAQVPRYTVTDIGPFEPRGVNDVGQATGRAIINGRGFAALYDGAFKTINPPGAASAEAWAVNNRGQAIGTAFYCDIVDGNCVNGRSRAFIYRGGAFTTLGTLGGRDSFGSDINDAGLAVGASSTPGPAPDRSGDSQAFSSSSGQLDNIGAKLGVGGSRASAVNSAGQVLGHFGDRNGSGEFLYDTRDGTFSLFPVGGFSRDLNDRGEVVGGLSGNDDGSGRAFLYANGVVRNLGTLLPSHTYSTAWAINNAGQIVGVSSQSWFTRQDEHAFIYEGGLMRDLNALIPANSGWVLNVATDINEHGQIVGFGKLNGQERGFMLTPVEPVVLLTEPDSTKALALDSVTFERDAFSVKTPRNFSADGRRRVTLFARNVEFATGETAQQLSVQAEDGHGQTHLLPVEHVERVRGFPSFAQITVRLIDALSAGGDFHLSVTFRGATSNKTTLSIKPTSAAVAH
jgi:probable HAF family extracellular repeat protein